MRARNPRHFRMTAHPAFPPLFFALAVSLALSPGTSAAAGLPEGCMAESEARTILDKTLTVRLAPDLSNLTFGERKAVDHLIAAGRIIQDLYERQKHHQAEEARTLLERLRQEAGPRPAVDALTDLYRLSQGPIVTTLDNRRVPFLPVAGETPGKNVYPADLTREEMNRFLVDQPGERPALLHARGIVRRARLDNVESDLKTLGHHPALDLLHPGLRKRLETLSRFPSKEVLYAVPYSVAWAGEIVAVYQHLLDAAAAVEADDAAFARFLRLRARDLLADDYEGGDAAWVTGSFGNLNAQIGSYETYDDALYGVKSFFSFSVLKRDAERSASLREAVRGLQEIEEVLPYEPRKRVREGIPIGVYDVVADFGQSRSANTATILPNESHLARQYGRTIMIRANIMRDPGLFEESASAFRAAVPPEQADHLTPEGSLQRTLWHEIGHYLGVDRTRDGRELDEALQDTADLLEEMKSDLVSLFAVEPLKAKGYYDEASARSVYASGIRRVLQKTKPRRDQPYQTMQLMQWNWLLERRVLVFDPAAGTMRIDYGTYRAAVGSLLREVLAIQAEGSRERAEEFVKRWTAWRDDLHQVVADRMKATERTRFTLVRYAALGE